MDELYEKLNQLLCNLVVASQNIHILHWNLTDDEFIFFHPYLGEIYDNLNDQVDIVAERIRFKQMFPHAQLSKCVKESDISQIDSLKIYDIEESLNIAISNIQNLNNTTQELVTYCDNTKEWALVNDLSPFLSYYEKTLYFLKNSQEQDKE